MVLILRLHALVAGSPCLVDMHSHTFELEELYSQLKDKPWAEITDDDDDEQLNTWNREETRDAVRARDPTSRFMSVTNEPATNTEQVEALSWRATMSDLPTSTTPIKSPQTTISTTPKPGSILAGIYNTLTTDAARIEEALRREREEQAELKRQVDANWKEREARMREEGERLAKERGIERDTRVRTMEKEILEIRRSRATNFGQPGYNRSVSPSHSPHSQSHPAVTNVTIIQSNLVRTPRIKQIFVKVTPDQPEMIIQLH